ncbi:MAG TPA: hypothetical protein VFT53_02655 [Candidatus Saccharimonadales bacterium]|nr:hypothetical protein [Candidatus Saccharimonadales bacterium]
MDTTTNTVDQLEQVQAIEPDELGDLLYITRAYNREEISFDEWLRRSRAWAERVIREHKKRA